MVGGGVSTVVHAGPFTGVCGGRKPCCDEMLLCDVVTDSSGVY